MENITIIPKFFTIVNLTSNRFASRNGGSEIKFTKHSIDQYCYMRLIKQIEGTNKIIFAMDNGRIVCTYPSEYVHSTDNINDPSAIFEFIRLEDGNFAMRASNGKFVSAYDLGGITSLKACKVVIDKFCRFKIEEPYYKKQIVRVDYDLAKATIKDETPISAGSLHVENKSSEPSSSTVTYSFEKSVEGTWNNTVGTELTVATSFSAGVPFIADTKLEISVTASASHSWGGSEGKRTTFSGQVSTTVPPMKKGVLKAMVANATMVVPFSYRTKTWYNNGEIIEKNEKGSYVNLESYNIYVNNDQLNDI